MQTDRPTTTQDDIQSVVDEQGREFIARKHRFPANAAGFLLAPIVWMLYFVFVYSLQGAGCAAGLDLVRLNGANMLDIVLGILTLTASAAIVVSGIWSFVVWRRLLRDLPEGETHARRATFLAYGALLHAGLFLVAVIWSGIPILLIDACDTLGTA